MNFDLIILGAGAAGLYGALRASQQGLSVLVLDLAKEVGQKFRLAGGGHANITNLQMDSQYYVSQNPSFCTQVLKKFPPRLSLDLLAEFNIPWEERDHGRIFCTVPVSKLIQAMKETCVAKKVVFGLGFPIGEVNYAQKLFHVQHNRQVYTAPNLMAALGSPAWPACGASDYGIHLAKSFGHKIWPFKPVLCPLILDANSPLQGLAGISLEVEASVGERKFTDALLFTHKGLSGPAILQASCFWQRQDSVYGTIYLNFLPKHNIIELMHQPENGKTLLRTLVSRLMPSRLAEKLLSTPELAICGDIKIAQLSKKSRQDIFNALHKYPFIPNRREGLHRAEAASGGLDTTELNSNFMSTKQPNLYFAGEMLDITGLLGGYNLHFAFASAYAVIKSVSKKKSG